MRVVKLEEFLKLPPGTVYEVVRKNHVAEGEIRIKGDTYNGVNDWNEVLLGGACVVCNDEYPSDVDGWCALEDDPKLRIPYEIGMYGRFGLYPKPEDGYQFFIYEPNDIAKLIMVLSDALVTQLDHSGDKMTLKIDDVCEKRDPNRNVLSVVLAALPSHGREKDD